MYRWFLAWRYLLQRPINLLGVIAVTLAAWALVVVVSIFSGYIVEIRRHVHATTGDVVVNRLPVECSFARIAPVLLADPNVAACAPRITWPGLLHPTGGVPAAAARPDSGEDSRFVHLIGIDPQAELAVSGLRAWLRAPERPELRVAEAELLRPAGGDDDPVPSILLSERRLAVEGLQPGARVDVTCTRLYTERTQSVELETVRLAVQGAFGARFVMFDATHALVHIDTMRALLRMKVEDACNEVVVALRDESTAVETAARLQRALADRLSVRDVGVYTWEETNALFLSAVDHQRSLFKLILFVIMVVAAFLMFATLSMMVTEKVHDVGILTAMGATRFGVFQVFLACGLAIAATGAVLGVGVGCLTAVNLDGLNTWLRTTFGVDLFPTRIYNLEHVPFDLDPAWLLQVAGMALGVGAVVSGIPAWLASRHDPVESLRNE